MRFACEGLKPWMCALALSVSAMGAGLAQGNTERQDSSGSMTKQQLLKSLEDLEVKLQALQRPPASKERSSPAIARGPKSPAQPWEFKRAPERRRPQLDLERLQALRAPDVAYGLDTFEARERESGIGRLQRHQRELTSQKLGDQLIILNPGP
jgi:hypothetical protein